MTSETPIRHDKSYSLNEKVEFLKRPEVYPFATHVDALETHMSWVFLTDHYVYKLKKPVYYDFLDFRTLEARYDYCMEEVRINQPLAGDTYVGIVALKMHQGVMQLNGKGEPIDWLVKMKRLPEEHMLHNAIKEGNVHNELMRQAAAMLADFYIKSPPIGMASQQYRKNILRDIEQIGKELLKGEFKLQEFLITTITTVLVEFLTKQAELFDQRIADGRLIEAHGDLRPEHICLAPNLVIIDRIEFNKDLRIMDVAEELSFLALECEMLGSTTIGQLFLSVYKEKSLDEIPDILISFYKAKRAFLRGKLSIHHLLEKRYRSDEQKWRSRCNNYLLAANAYCQQLQKSLTYD